MAPLCDNPIIECTPTSADQRAIKEYSPSYLVEFWQSGGTLQEVWRVQAAVDVMQVAGWASAQEIGDTFAIYVEHATEGRAVMLRVYDGLRRNMK